MSEIAKYAQALSDKFEYLYEHLVVKVVRVKEVEKHLDAEPAFRSCKPSVRVGDRVQVYWPLDDVRRVARAVLWGAAEVNPEPGGGEL